jgi:predicted transcriptional regulator
MIMVQQDATASEAMRMMRDRAVRRLLVCDRDRQLVGILSIGDLALEMDRDSALADISAAPPNN